MLKPISDHILVKPLPLEEVTRSGIFLPETSKEKPQQGEVIAVGSGKYVGEKLISFNEIGINKGDLVMFSKYGPTEIKIDGVEYYILDLNDILGVISKELDGPEHIKSKK